MTDCHGLGSGVAHSAKRRQGHLRPAPHRTVDNAPRPRQSCVIVNWNRFRREERANDTGRTVHLSNTPDNLTCSQQAGGGRRTRTYSVQPTASSLPR